MALNNDDDDDASSILSSSLSGAEDPSTATGHGSSSHPALRNETKELEKVRSSVALISKSNPKRASLTFLFALKSCLETIRVAFFCGKFL